MNDDDQRVLPEGKSMIEDDGEANKGNENDKKTEVILPESNPNEKPIKETAHSEKHANGTSTTRQSRFSAAASGTSDSEGESGQPRKRRKHKRRDGKESCAQMLKIEEFGKFPAGEQLTAFREWAGVLHTALGFAPDWDEQRKMSYVLLAGGRNLRDIVNLFGLMPESKSHPFQELMTNIEEHFVELTDPTLTHQAIMNCKQEASEAASEFYLRLMKLVGQSGSEFGTEYIRTHFLNGLRDKGFANLAVTSGWSLRDAVAAASRKESVQSRVTSPLAGGTMESIAAVGQSGGSPHWQRGGRSFQGAGGQSRFKAQRGGSSGRGGQTRSGVPCQACGNVVHRFGTCPAINKSCLGCGQVGHFKKMCRQGKKVNAVRGSRKEQVENEDWD